MKQREIGRVYTKNYRGQTTAKKTEEEEDVERNINWVGGFISTPNQETFTSFASENKL